MPKYDFYCDNCDDQYEVTLAFDKVGSGFTCVCGHAMRRVYTANPAIFKGDGWAGRSSL